MDDLDNEVQKIAKKSNEQQSSSNEPLKHEEIKISFPEDQPKKEKASIEEKKIFEGSNMSIWANKLLQSCLQSIKVVGFNTNKIPAITNLSHLMNCSFYLRKEKTNLEDAIEVDFM
jgi:hypothetical protein